MFWTELVRWLAEETGEPLDSTDVGAYSRTREVASLEFLQHDLAKSGHRDLLVTRRYPESSPIPTARESLRVASAAPAASFWSAARRCGLARHCGWMTRHSEVGPWNR